MPWTRDFICLYTAVAILASKAASDISVPTHASEIDESSPRRALRKLTQAGIQSSNRGGNDDGPVRPPPFEPKMQESVAYGTRGQLGGGLSGHGLVERNWDLQVRNQPTNGGLHYRHRPARALADRPAKPPPVFTRPPDPSGAPIKGPSPAPPRA